MSEALGLSDDAVDTALQMNQRSRIIDIDDGVALMILYGLSPSTRQPVELHVIITTKFVVTVHGEDCLGLNDVRRHVARKPPEPREPLLVLHQVVEAIADEYFPVLAEFDDAIDEVEDGIFTDPTDELLQRLFRMKRDLIGYRKVVTPMRDMLGAVFNGVVELPGLTNDNSGWMRDVYDHMIRISDLIDSYRDLMSGAMDAYLSTVSNRLNVVMKQLAIIATIFLPLSWITGFFGRNFGVIVRNITGRTAFWIFAIGLELAVAVAMLVLFRKRKWI